MTLSFYSWNKNVACFGAVRIHKRHTTHDPSSILNDLGFMSSYLKRTLGLAQSDALLLLLLYAIRGYPTDQVTERLLRIPSPEGYIYIYIYIVEQGRGRAGIQTGTSKQQCFLSHKMLHLAIPLHVNYAQRDTYLTIEVTLSTNHVQGLYHTVDLRTRFTVNARKEVCNIYSFHS